MNGADWSVLRHRLAHADSSRVSIVHIGDSHLQADMATSVVRRRLPVGIWRCRTRTCDSIEDGRYK